MGRAAAYIAGGVALLVVILVAADASTRSSTCMACHTREAAFAEWMADRLKAEKKGFSHELIACADCHMEGGAEGTLMSRFRGLLHIAEYIVPQIDPRRPEVSGIFRTTRIPRENCVYCHEAAEWRKIVFLRDLPDRLKEIGLQMDHRKHLLEREDTCAQCHERYQKGTGEPDKAVNYAEVNHLNCDACHATASHAYRSGRIMPLTKTQFIEARESAWRTLSQNPRWMVAVPTEKTCRRCHNGKIHFKKKIFLADCSNGTNYKNCVKCHPWMTERYFERHRRKQNTATTASAEVRNDG